MIVELFRRLSMSAVNPLKSWRRFYVTVAITRADDACLFSVI